MRLQNTAAVLAIIMVMAVGNTTFAQSKAYKRKAAPAPTSATPSAATAPTGTTDKAAATAPPKAEAPGSEKLDISDLEKKYWAPKDTDFTVVQNRNYTKAGKFALSGLVGPIVNDAFNEGNNYAVSVNYYLDERYGFEGMFISSDLKNSDVTSTFIAGLGGGSTAPDFNRPVSYYGVGFNWVPFYAKMSFLGKKIIYFDMQVTPHLGMSSYEQQNTFGNGSTESGVFSYGLDVTQYFFFSKNLAVRANLHNRWYNEDIVYYKTDAPRRSDTTNITNFLMGVTFFFN